MPPQSATEFILQKVRNYAHGQAISYHELSSESFGRHSYTAIRSALLRLANRGGIVGRTMDGQYFKRDPERLPK